MAIDCSTAPSQARIQWRINSMCYSALSLAPLPGSQLRVQVLSCVCVRVPFYSRENVTVSSLLTRFLFALRVLPLRRIKSTKFWPENRQNKRLLTVFPRPPTPVTSNAGRHTFRYSCDFYIYFALLSGLLAPFCTDYSDRNMLHSHLSKRSDSAILTSCKRAALFHWKIESTAWIQAINWRLGGNFQCLMLI